MPNVQADLHASVGQSQWIISAFLVALCTCMMAAGRMADQYGRRRLLYLGLALFGLSSLGAGFAGNIGSLIAFRFVQGISCAVLYTSTAAIVANAFPENERGRVLGMLFGANGIGLAVGPVVGRVLVSAFGWRSVFLVNAPFILLSFAICLYSVGESRNVGGRDGIDWRGLLLGITQGQHWGWLSSKTLSSFVVATALLASLVRVERTVASPIIRMDLFLSRNFIHAGIATFLMAFFYCVALCFCRPLESSHCYRLLSGGRLTASDPGVFFWWVFHSLLYQL
ncbi:MFS transporter [Paraburkholderia aspalathi]|nr:MFS transporter [Paraburkholderia sp. SECH2]MDQ6397533.1 MFS transporter [Paraburkholderia aspalathi]